jgi:hypothetical protein
MAIVKEKSSLKKKKSEITKKIQKKQKNHRQNSAKYRQQQLSVNREAFLQNRALQVKLCRKKKAQKLLETSNRSENGDTLLETTTSNASNSNQSMSPSSYNTKSALKKAVQRAKKSLPRDFEHAKEVVAVLSTHYKTTAVPQPKLAKIRQSTELMMSLVKTFYCTDLISKQMPGQKDFVKLNGEKVQKRAMIMTVKEAFEEFQLTYPNDTISRSHFYSLRPPFVCLPSDATHFSCCCEICENGDLVYSCLKTHLSQPSLKELIESAVCSTTSFECMTGNCENCNTFDSMLQDLVSSLTSDSSPHMKFQIWEKAENGFMQKAQRKEQVAQIMERFRNMFRKITLHKYLTKVQFSYFKDFKENLNSTEAAIHMDFSQNYSSIGQNDLQSSYFGRAMISVKTVIVYVANHDPISIVIVNDDTTHSKEQVFFYLDLVINYVKQSHPQLKSIKIFTDGCSSQYKNKFMLVSLLFSKVDFGLDAEWHFSTTSHGKGAVDGLGGTIKRNVANRVLSTPNLTVYNAKEFYECALTFVDKIKMFIVNQADVQQFFEQKLMSRWDKIKKIMLTGSRDCHSFRPDYRSKSLIAAASSAGDGELTFKLVKKL